MVPPPPSGGGRRDGTYGALGLNPRSIAEKLRQEFGSVGPFEIGNNDDDDMVNDIGTDFENLMTIGAMCEDAGEKSGFLANDEKTSASYSEPIWFMVDSGAPTTVVRRDAFPELVADTSVKIGLQTITKQAMREYGLKTLVVRMASGSKGVLKATVTDSVKNALSVAVGVEIVICSWFCSE
jgi:hypothetical protein